MKSGNPNFLEHSGPLQACNWTDRRQLDVSLKPRKLYPLERTGTRGIEGWVDLRTGLKRYGKLRPIGVEARTIQSVAKRYESRNINTDFKDYICL